MTTKNIEWLIGRLRAFSGTSLAPALMHQAADTLQSQAERVKALELDLDVQAGSIEAVQAVNMRQAECIKELIDSVNFKHSKITELENERDTLRAHLAEIEKAEPVIWAISYDGVTPYTLWHEGDGPLLDCEVKRQGGTTQKMPLFTRPMPAQDVTELVEALEKLARLGNGEHYGNSNGNMIARDALSKYKGAK